MPQENSSAVQPMLCLPGRRVDLNAAALGRTESMFASDVTRTDHILRSQIHQRRLLVVGGGGSIGASTVRLLSR